MWMFHSGRRARPGWQDGGCLMLALLLIAGLGLASSAVAAPVLGKAYDLKQPDGTTINTRIWGDEFYQVVESPDGYTLVRDLKTEWICYAKLPDDGNDLVSSGIVALDKAPATPKQPQHIRINPEAARKKALAVREYFRRGEQETLAAMDGAPSPTPPRHEDTKGSI